MGGLTLDQLFKVDKGRSEVIDALSKSSFSAKKNRGREGWLAPAGFKSVNREEERGASAFLTSNLHRRARAFTLSRAG